MSTRIALGAAVTEHAGTEGAAQAENTPPGRVAVRRDGARRRACDARRGRRLRLRDRAACGQRLHGAFAAAVTLHPALQRPSPTRRKAVRPS